MTPRLERLGTRVLGRAPTVAPRIASRFEPTGEDTTAAGITIQSTMPPAAPPAMLPPREPMPIVRVEKQIQAPAPQLPAIAPEPPRRVEKEAPRPDVKVVAAPQTLSPPAPAPGFHELPEAPAPSRSPAPSPAAPVIVEKQALAEDVHQRREPERPVPATEPDTVSKRDLATELRRLRGWMTDAAPSKAEPAAPAEPAMPRSRAVGPKIPRSLPPPPLVRTAPAPVPPPAIEINIGTIIVRATNPDARAPATSAPVDRTAGLAHFLARRSAGLP